MTGEIDAFNDEKKREEAYDQKMRDEQGGQQSLYDSAIGMGELYVALKEMGVDKENILDLMRIVFMFAGPSDPQMVANAIADTSKKEPAN